MSEKAAMSKRLRLATAPETMTTTKRDTALDRLILPEEHKRMVLSLIAQHFEEKKSRKAEMKRPIL